MRKTLLMAALALGLCAASPALAQQAQGAAFPGQMMLVAFNYCPQGWHAADGSPLLIQQNMQLYALIGTTYGGNGKTTFALPQVKGPPIGPGAPISMLYCIALTGPYPLHAAAVHAGGMMGPGAGGMMGPKTH
ncbi:MAG TPA: phage tail protein [Rhizomicrobium sp.]|jgi:hypothetical protein|nr:phage tail protein [Rhizomicrobium sp.]